VLKAGGIDSESSSSLWRVRKEELLAFSTFLSLQLTYLTNWKHFFYVHHQH